MQFLDWRSLDKHVEVAHGEVDAERFTLYSIFHNELFFCAPFLDHYRSIGVEQFIIYDDNSSDGTREFLETQPDTVVLRSDFNYSDRVWCRPSSRTISKKGFHHFLKSAIPKFFLGHRFALCADADEFLLLPPDASDVRAVVDGLHSIQAGAIVSSLVDFFPQHVSGMKVDLRPRISADLFNSYGFFEETRIVDVDGSGMPVSVNPDKLRQLFLVAGISTDNRRRRRLFHNLRRRDRRNEMSYKTPIVRHDADVFYRTSHRVNRSAPDNRLLTMAHFVFTANSYQKACNAVRESHRRSRVEKYKKFLCLIDKFEREERPLAGTHSQRFENVQQLLDADLMRWPETQARDTSSKSDSTRSR